MLLVSFGLFAVILLPIFVQDSVAIQISEHGAVGGFRLSDQNVLFETDCVQATWSVEHIRAVKFEDRPVTGVGSGQACDGRAALSVEFTDGERHTYAIRKYSLGNTLLKRAGLAAAVGLLLSSIALSGTWGAAVRRLRLARVYHRLADLLPPLSADRPSAMSLTLALVVVGGLTLLAMMLRTHYLSRTLNHDEAWTYLEYASQPLTVTLSRYTSTNNHIFQSLLVHIATAIWGRAEWVIRLPVLFAGLLLIPVTYQFGKQFYGRAVGYLAAGWMVGSSYIIELSTSARGYAMVALAFLLLLLIGKRLCHRPTRKRWAAYALVSALGFYAIPTMLYPFIAATTWLMVSLWLTYGGAVRLRVLRDFVMTQVAAGTITLLLYLPALGFYMQHRSEDLDVEHLASIPWLDTLWRLRDEFQVAWQFWNRDLAAGVVVIMAVAALLTIVLNRRLEKTPFSLAVAAVVSLAIVLLVQSGQTFARIWSFATPVYYVWVSAGLVLLWQLVPVPPLRRQMRSISVMAAFGVAGLTAAGTLTSNSVMESMEGFRINDVKAAVASVVAKPADDPVYCLGLLCEAYKFYALDTGIEVVSTDAVRQRDAPYYLIIAVGRNVARDDIVFADRDLRVTTKVDTDLIFDSVDTRIYHITPAEAADE